MKTVKVFACALACAALVCSCDGSKKDGKDPVKFSDMNYKDFKVLYDVEKMQPMAEGASSDHRYVVGSNYVTFAPVIWDVVADKAVDFPKYEGGTFHAVSKTGVAVGEMENGYAIIGNMDGTISELYADKGELVEEDWGSFYNGESGSSAYAITDDGSVVAGFYFDAEWNTTPCIWKDGGKTRVDLPVPTEDECGFPVSGAEARGISADGKIIMGFVIDDFSTWPLILWRMNSRGSYEVDVVCAKFFHPDGVDNKKMFFQPFSISANGKWVGLNVCEPYDWQNWAQPEYKAARYNTSTGALEILADSDMCFEPYGIANDGTCVGAQGNMEVRGGVIWKAGEATAVKVSEFLPEVEYVRNAASLTPVWIAPDRSAVAGFGMDEEYNIASFVVL